MQKTLVKATSYLQLYPIKEPDYSFGAQVIPKLTHWFINLKIF